MTRRRLGWSWAGFWFGAWLVSFTLCVADVHAKPPHVRLAPPVPCTMHNHMDVFIDEDLIMWACECEALVTIHICHWQVIGGVDAPSARRYRRRHPRASVAWSPRLIPPLVIHA